MSGAWRIVKTRHAATAFSGEGAAKAGGRWNSRGTWVVYTSSTKALATLESLVHLNPPVTFSLVAIPITFPDSLVETYSIADLPPDWRSQPPPPSTQSIGNAWVAEARSAILALPSVITGEPNYLLNPAHPDFAKIRIGHPEPYVLDPRLLA